MKRRYHFERKPRTGLMARIVMKWGGGLITDKSSLCTVLPNRIELLAKTVRQIHEMGHDLVIVHGAGSFGHIRAKEFRLAEGNIPEIEQYEAIELVRGDMDQLHAHVIKALGDLPVHSHPPREFVKNTGSSFDGNLGAFLVPGIHVTFGDVVNCDPPADFGILSGDDLMMRLSNELPDVICSIFAMGGTPGVMTDSSQEADLIPLLTTETGFSGVHDEKIDVTGGIFLKVERAFEIAKHVEHVWFIDGHHPSRMLEIINTGDTIGTRIVK
ncbi:MAG TPA: hypothetical protein D7I10_02470 [Candidatus Poseidoniales archaeon]|nr:MAG TPA: hypothetical protein D7I10_02470 [Candidatus Poseidoniales archaeon]